MSDAAAPPIVFALSYDMRPVDLETLAMSPRLKRLRRGLKFGLPVYVLLGAACTALTVVLPRHSAAEGSSRSLGVMYGIDVVVWLLACLLAWAAWILSPRQLARRTWRRNPWLHGRHRDEIRDNGVTWIAP